MTIFNMTDLHGSLTYLGIARSEIAAADLVLITGDITNFGGRREAKAVIEAIADLNSNVLAVSGNCDRPEVEEYLRELGIALDGTPRRVGVITFAGLSGSLPGPIGTPNTFSEEELTASLERIETDLKGPLVLVSHQPPFDTSADRVLSGRHVGSRAVRLFIESARPLLCLTGHIHESVGDGMLAGCRVINPGPFGQGRYALVEIERDGSLEVRMRGA